MHLVQGCVQQRPYLLLCLIQAHAILDEILKKHDSLFSPKAIGIVASMLIQTTDNIVDDIPPTVQRKR